MKAYKFEIYIPKDCFEDTFEVNTYDEAVKQLMKKWGWGLKGAHPGHFKFLGEIDVKKMTNDEANKYEQLLRDAKKLCKEAYQMVYGVPDWINAAGECLAVGEAITKAIAAVKQIRQ